METNIFIPKRQHEKIKHDFSYLKAILIELSENYEKQLEDIEDFAMWNLPTEIASSWDNIDYFIDELLKFKVIGDEVASLLKLVRNNFYEVSYEGKNFDADIWTHEALKSSSFWQKQREIAKNILNIISTVKLVKI